MLALKSKRHVWNTIEEGGSLPATPAWMQGTQIPIYMLDSCPYKYNTVTALTYKSTLLGFFSLFFNFDRKKRFKIGYSLPKQLYRPQPNICPCSMCRKATTLFRVQHWLDSHTLSYSCTCPALLKLNTGSQ